MSAVTDWQPDLHCDEYQSDPAPTLARLRAEDPVHKSRHGYWFLTRYRDVLSALRDPRFSSDWALRREVMSKDKPGDNIAKPSRYEENERDKANREVILTSFNMRDGEAHRRIRALVNKAFSRATLEGKRERIEALAHELLPPEGEARDIDLVKELGFPLPIQVSSELIGIPVDAREQFRSSFEESGLLSLPKRTPEQHKRGLAALDWQLTFMREQVEDRRTNPREDLFTALVEAEEEGDRLSVDETLSTIITIFTAAGTTTERFISSGLYLLIQHPEQMRALREDRSLMDGALEEILRFHHPDQSTTTPRWITEDLELGDKTLKRGDQVRFSIGAANRDPEQFENPEQFDIRRNPNRHLSFGSGAHVCLGAPMARLVGEVAFTTVLDRGHEPQMLTEKPRRDPRRMDRYEELLVRL